MCRGLPGLVCVEPFGDLAAKVGPLDGGRPLALALEYGRAAQAQAGGLNALTAIHQGQPALDPVQGRFVFATVLVDAPGLAAQVGPTAGSAVRGVEDGARRRIARQRFIVPADELVGVAQPLVGGQLLLGAAGYMRGDLDRRAVAVDGVFVGIDGLGAARGLHLAAQGLGPLLGQGIVLGQHLHVLVALRALLGLDRAGDLIVDVTAVGIE